MWSTSSIGVWLWCTERIRGGAEAQQLVRGEAAYEGCEQHSLLGYACRCSVLPRYNAWADYSTA